MTISVDRNESLRLVNVVVDERYKLLFSSCSQHLFFFSLLSLLSLYRSFSSIFVRRQREGGTEEEEENYQLLTG